MFFKYISRSSSVGDMAIPIAGPFFMWTKELEGLKYSSTGAWFSSLTSTFLFSSASFPLSVITVLDMAAAGRITENKSFWKIGLALLVKITLYLEKQKENVDYIYSQINNTYFLHSI